LASKQKLGGKWSRGVREVLLAKLETWDHRKAEEYAKVASDKEQKNKETPGERVRTKKRKK